MNMNGSCTDMGKNQHFQLKETAIENALLLFRSLSYTHRHNLNFYMP